MLFCNGQMPETGKMDSYQTDISSEKVRGHLQIPKTGQGRNSNKLENRERVSKEVNTLPLGPTRCLGCGRSEK
jgi:hypothetical protein